MIECQKDKFSLPDGITYLNAAYMSPQLKSVEEAGITALRKKNQPYKISADDFFANRNLLKKKFAGLIALESPQQIAIVPSASYGIANAARNISLKEGEEIVMVAEQFPSHVYSWKRLADSKGGVLRTVTPPDTFENRGEKWNESILEQITDKTAVVALPHVHWADGTLFDLKAIRKKSREHGALLVVDGTQSVGALPFSIKELKPDALICAGYKWLLGPYSLGLAYYSESFNEGIPIEENWINRLNSEDFKGLTAYQEKFQPGAERYSVGESSNFNHIPMLLKAVEELLLWKPENIQHYCQHISAKAVSSIREAGYFIEEDAYRAKHLFGIYLRPEHDLESIKSRMESRNIYVSYRGEAIRVSPHLYNTTADFERLASCFQD
ncbi:aminotransferase class V-fold PLP-dependent enzyme [Lentiprolixibacter aurantiacus]|uniref:Aminotransferase class V-fold PLP-dependent enzyme n=1 Tax=Lentiprolixibacter aurantiacus TaxID=2993939 RepID=A0AAE3MJZ7_9FLAO|nr:aminotransferase class V-fold PLP-dependent enzyme [Lentiprolixibacter aurantiacus]MCX2718834.1 aminotransferase class V-fold PLP-dependent enzyme [Lentiprolixibacter aurantiacus]